MTPGDQQPEQPSAVLIYQVQQLEKQTGIGFRHVDERLDRLETEMRSSLAALTFVSEKAYTADRSADLRIQTARDKVLDDAIAEARKIAENARTTAWAVATLLLVVTGTLLAVIKAVAG